MKLTWSAFALSDRDAIFTYLEADNPAAAVLIDFPASDHVGRIAGTRELFINGTPYVAAYAITETTVRILRVLHGAQKWPDYLPTS